MSLETAPRLVVLCDRSGRKTGTSEIVAAHRDGGQLHQAFSVFVFRSVNDQYQLLLQRRSKHKPLFADRWTNTCCSHPRPTDDDICKAGERRLQEEFGFTLPLEAADSFVYRATDTAKGGTEYEHDTVLIGHATTEVRVETDPREIAEYKWVSLDELRRELDQCSDDFSPWFLPALSIALQHLEIEEPSD